MEPLDLFLGMSFIEVFRESAQISRAPADSAVEFRDSEELVTLLFYQLDRL